MSWLDPSLPLLTENDLFQNLPLGTYFFLPRQSLKFMKIGRTRANTYTGMKYEAIELTTPVSVWRVIEQ
jgi:hypothetical protein